MDGGGGKSTVLLIGNSPTEVSALEEDACLATVMTDAGPATLSLLCKILGILI
jgi:hypothetical protein